MSAENSALPSALKKTNAMVEEVNEAPSISIGDYTLELVEDLTFLGSNISSNLSLEAEINKRIGKAASAMSRLSTTACESTNLTTNTGMQGLCID